MRTKSISKWLMALLALMLGMLACGQFGGASPIETPTASFTETPMPSPTATKPPTKTPLPTNTPNLAATQAMDDANTKIQSYVDAGYLSNTEGKLVFLDDYFREMAKKNYLDVDTAGYEDSVKNFAVWGRIKLQTARPVSGYEYSGCGFSFRINPKNFDGYTLHMTDSSILVTYCDASINRCGRLGKTRGTGTLEKLSNPAEADVELIVNNTQAYVRVDGKFIAEYTLFTEKLLDPGYFLYSIISGTNAEYGTRCEIKDARLWKVE